MYVCSDCAVLHLNGDYSGTGWDAALAEEIATNLAGYVIIIEDDPRFVMDNCLGCGQSGIDAYRAGYFDDDGELVTN